MNYHEKYKSFYQENKWRDLRQQVFLEANGLCEECLKKKIIMEGKEVHHIVPINTDWSKRYERTNLILLCDECHNKIHNRQSPLQEFNKFWEELNGNL
jgi:5-methylcytosine-specific restriction enzyme A